MSQFTAMTPPDGLQDLVAQLRPRLRNVIGVTIGKGGEGKTTTGVTLSHMLAQEQQNLAQQGHEAKPILYIELDSNGNGRLDLKILGGEFDDDGNGFVGAVTEDKPFTVVRNVKPYLDMTVAGSANSGLAAEISRLASKHVQAPYLMLGMLLAQISHNYAWIIVDFSPGDVSVQRLGLAAVTHLVLPVKNADDAMLGGLQTIANLVAEVRLINPELGIAAIGFLGFKKVAGEATAELDIVRVKIELLLEAAGLEAGLVMQDHIREARALSTVSRNNGLPARELALAANELLLDESGASVPRPRYANGRLVEPDKALDLAEDWTTFTGDVIKRVVSRTAELEGVAA
ncbi:ParA family protein [Streptomyces sp. NBC_01433]|uniref:ParA family protein n=1 Tax=Streptomyces sp. NBC_01433 TaxID=2903864 RepID=UPI0022525448|nr:ParA family protein [Streptomyces sp. NBC_01433]MCX4681594.1 ParA family protein [Streptomyces sp. NBC_01433]